MAEPKGKLVTPIAFDPNGNPVALEVDVDGNLKVTGGDGVSTFKALTDTPGTYVDQAGKRVRVKAGEDGLEFVVPPATEFKALIDTPATYVDQGGKRIRVKAGEDGLEFVAPPATEFKTLIDTPATYVDQGGKRVRVKAGEDGLEFVAAGDGSFVALDDTPADYTDQAKKHVVVNVAEDALEFVDPGMITTAKARVYLSTVQTIPHDSYTLVALDNVHFDPSGIVDIVNHRMTFKVKGTYLAIGATSWDNDGIVVNKMIMMYVALNAGDLQWKIIHTAKVDYIVNSWSDIIKIDIGDYIELYAYHDFGNDAYLMSDVYETSLSVHLLSID